MRIHPLRARSTVKQLNPIYRDSSVVRIADLPVGAHSLDRHPAIELLLIGIENFLYAETEVVRFHLAVLEATVDIVARRGPADDVLAVEFVEFVKVFLWGGRKGWVTLG